MKRKLTSGILMLTAALTVSSAFYSCKDYDDERVDAYQKSLDQNTANWKAADQALETKLNAAIAAACQCEVKTSQQVSDLITSALTSYATTAYVDGNFVKNDDLDSKLANYVTTTEAANYATNSAVQAAIQAALTNTSDTSAIVNTFKQLLEDNGYDDIFDALLYNEETGEFGILDGVKDSINDINDNIKLLFENDSILFDNDSILAVEIQKANGRIDTVNIRVDELQAKVDSFNTKLAQLDAKVEALYDMMKKQVTGVIAQATYNPVVGTFSLPVGLQSNILAGYYGQAMNACAFPTNVNEALLDQSEAFTDAELAIVNTAEGALSWASGSSLIGSEGAAGTIYVTVNPSTVDFEGKTLTLVNSQDEEAGIQLDTLAKSDQILTFGMSRAAGNGFYEAKAKIVDPSKCGINFNTSGLKEVANDILTYKDGINFTNAAMQIMEAASDLGDAYALKATYEDTLGEHSVYSNYNIGAYAVNPLGYGFLKNSQYNNLGRIPTLPSQLTVESLGLSDFNISGVDFSFNDTIKDVTVKFYLGSNATEGVDGKGQIEVPNADELVVKYNYTVKESNNTTKTESYYKKNNKWYIDETCKVPSDGPKTASENYFLSSVDLIWGTKTVLFSGLDKETDESTQHAGEYYIEQTVSLASINDMLKNYTSDVNKSINDMISDINGKINGITNNDKLNKVFDTYNKYVGKVNSLINRLNKSLSDVNAKLQPLLVADINGTYTAISNTAGIGNPVRFADVEDGLPLYLTSYTCELLAPAYKKYVAVVDAVKDGVSYPEVAKAANASSVNFNEVLEGNEYVAGFTGAAGYTYTIAYACADYNGKVTIKRFYITVND